MESRFEALIWAINEAVVQKNTDKKYWQKDAFFYFYPSDLVNSKTTIPLRVDL